MLLGNYLLNVPNLKEMLKLPILMKSLNMSIWKFGFCLWVEWNFLFHCLLSWLSSLSFFLRLYFIFSIHFFQNFYCMVTTFRYWLKLKLSWFCQVFYENPVLVTSLIHRNFWFTFDFMSTSYSFKME